MIPQAAAREAVRVTLATDGFVGEGAAGWAFVARREDGREHRERGALEPCPSHVAEWAAMQRALAWALEALAPGDALEVRTDSQLVAKGLASRRPAMSGEAAEARAECRRLLARLAERGVRARVVRVGREENAAADRESRRGAQR